MMRKTLKIALRLGVLAAIGLVIKTTADKRRTPATVRNVAPPTPRPEPQPEPEPEPEPHRAETVVEAPSSVSAASDPHAESLGAAEQPAALDESTVAPTPEPAMSPTTEPAPTPAPKPPVAPEAVEQLEPEPPEAPSPPPTVATSPPTPAVEAAKPPKTAKAAKKAAAPRKAVTRKAPEHVPPDTPVAALMSWVEPVGSVCPPSHPIKVKLGSRVFRRPGTSSYDNSKPDRCYASPGAAERAGFQEAQR